MVESCVRPATSARRNTINSIAGSASAAIITSRLEPMPAETGADVHSGEGEEEARTSSSATMAIRSAVQLNSSPVAKVGTSAAATQIAAKVM